MKKLISVLLVLAWMLSLTGCGAESVSMDLKSIYEAMTAATDEELVLLEQERLLELYGIEESLYTEMIVGSYNSGMMAAEIWLVKAASADALTRLQTLAQNRLDQLDAESATYSPEMNKVAKKAQVICKGEYLAMICSQSVETLAEIFRQEG